MVNTFMDLDAGAIKALHNNSHGRPPIYPIRPIVRTGSTNPIDGQECITGLDNQPSGCVLFVSFGSGGTLSHNQILELAMGLAMSGHRFIWVVRCPNNDSADAGCLTDNGHVDPHIFLPKGFKGGQRSKASGVNLGATDPSPWTWLNWWIP